MTEPDGIEERTAFYEEAFATDYERIELDEMRADEERHDALLDVVPVRCVVHGHEAGAYCHRCGQVRS